MKITVNKRIEYRIYDFNVTNIESSDDDNTKNIDKKQFCVQMFGINDKGESCSIQVENFRPFFYLEVNENWTNNTKMMFIDHIKQKIGKYYENSITDCIYVNREKLYMFNCNKQFKFMRIEFANVQAFNQVKNLWYEKKNNEFGLSENGYIFHNTNIKIYESNIPPLLRLFHISNISPSGWIYLPKNKTVIIKEESKKTNCDYEYSIDYKHIIPLNEKETRVPYKICSFDIEASSSHGDFPIPIKTYKKLATNIVDYFENNEINREDYNVILKNIIYKAFHYPLENTQTDTQFKEQKELQREKEGSKGNYVPFKDIQLIYAKQHPSMEELSNMCDKWLSFTIKNYKKDSVYSELLTIEKLFEKIHVNNKTEGDDNVSETSDNDNTNEVEYYYNKEVECPNYKNKNATISDVIYDKTFDREGKINEINNSLICNFPRVEGDKVTFIGSTFMKYGEKEPYKNHCIVLNNSSPIDGAITENYSTEREVLMAWTDMIQRENPDIIIGYNIFGFDYEFMFRRSQENYCVDDFLKLSKNKEEICGKFDKETGKYKIEEGKLKIASGEFDTRIITMNGRLQIDLHNHYRRSENFPSYKLDYVSGHLICDFIEGITYSESNDETVFHTGNMTGLTVGCFIHFQEIKNSVNYLENGAKFYVKHIDDKTFTINGKISFDLSGKSKIQWGLAKDDVTPKDIFNMANGTDDDRAVVAKYCIQDCNLVQHLFNKSDILTGHIEMAKITSVPINFLVMRGQGIKLTSLISKKCRENNTLMPVLAKGDNEGYEGAVVLEPKCGLYLDNPIATLDFASLYPSSMISENLCHKSKVWTKEYDLAGNLIEETGEKDENGNYVYDNLPQYDYVDKTYDIFTYIRKTPKASPKKIKVGYKTCRFVQFSNGNHSIMPSILKELLAARKSTRKLIPFEKDEFMQNVLEQRQLSYKLTANSLYGQCGARTSTFYEKDVASCTTATGRMHLNYAKTIVEECYKNRVCETSQGLVWTNAEYIYGDTDSVFLTFNLHAIDAENKPTDKITGKKALEITIELAQKAGELASSFLKAPHDLEYEKTFMPYCLLSKKKYFGILYQLNPDYGKRKEMGNELKKRDSAPILKDIYGGIADILLIKQDIPTAIDFLKSSLRSLINGEYPIDKFIISKALRTGYKNPKSVAHNVLANRMYSRDPGNKPCSGDRIPFVYICTANKKALQGDRIETPTFIKENNLKIDYTFYIKNKIMRPIQKIFSLILEDIWKMQNKKAKIKKFQNDVLQLKNTTEEEEKFEEKLEKLKFKELQILLFDEFLRETTNKSEKMQSLTKFFYGVTP